MTTWFELVTQLMTKHPPYRNRLSQRGDGAMLLMIVEVSFSLTLTRLSAFHISLKEWTGLQCRRLLPNAPGVLAGYGFFSP